MYGKPSIPFECSLMCVRYRYITIDQDIVFYLSPIYPLAGGGSMLLIPKHSYTCYNETLHCRIASIHCILDCDPSQDLLTTAVPMKHRWDVGK